MQKRQSRLKIYAFAVILPFVLYYYTLFLSVCLRFESDFFDFLLENARNAVKSRRKKRNYSPCNRCRLFQE